MNQSNRRKRLAHVSETQVLPSVLGFRVWRPEFSASRPRDPTLWPLTRIREGPWVPGVNTSHDLPCEVSSLGYSPGLYSYHALTSLSRAGWGELEPLVAGITRSWGTVSVGPLSIAAEHAEILALLADYEGEMAREEDPYPFAVAYGVPVVTFAAAEDWAREFGDTIDEKGVLV